MGSSNCMSMITWNIEFQKSLRALCLKVIIVKECLEEIKCLVKAEISMILSHMISIKFKARGNKEEYIRKITHLSSKLKILRLELFNDLFVH